MGKRFKKKIVDEAVTSAPSSSPTLAGTLLGQQLGVTNIGRLFNITERHNGPHVLMKRSDSAFSWGFSETAGVSEQDSEWIMDTTSVPTEAIHACTPMTLAFIEEHWPILNSLLQSGVGSRSTVIVNEVARYYAVVIEALQMLTVPLAINYLVTSFDWSEIAPFSPAVPPSIWGLAEIFDAGDIGIVDRWKPYYSRMANKVLPPYMTASIMENAMPYIGNQYGHVLRLNVHRFASQNMITAVWTADDYAEQLDTYLDYLEGPLKTCHNVLASFLPFRVGPIAMTFRGYDPLLEEIDFNSSLKNFANFGDTGDPTNIDTITCGTASENGNSVIYYHKGPAPVVKAVVNTPIYEIISDVDDEFLNLSCQIHDRAYIIDDSMALILYDGDIPGSSNAARYVSYYPCRFQKQSAHDIEEGYGKAGFLPAIIAKEEIIRVNRNYSNLLFGNDALKAVLDITGGSSVRVISQAVANAWLSTR